MMGTKARIFQPMVHVSLEDLVPADHFYRHLERILDLSFVRDLVRDRYSAFGRPSIDPVVFFKLQLVMFFEGIRSERQLVYVGSDRLSVRWYSSAAAIMLSQEMSRPYQKAGPSSCANGTNTSIYSGG